MDSELTVDLVERDRIWPEWVESMNSFRSQQPEEVVYPPRRRSLASEYANYVRCPPPNTPTFDLLPHPTDVGCFPPFRNIIRAPEGTQMNDKPFESAFAQLPQLVDKWKKKLDAEVAELVTIPSHSNSTSDVQIVAPNSTIGPESPQVATDKLRATSMCNYRYPRLREDELERTGLGHDNIQVLNENFAFDLRVRLTANELVP
jgi:hypothetical protein